MLAAQQVALGGPLTIFHADFYLFNLLALQTESDSSSAAWPASVWIEQVAVWMAGGGHCWPPLVGTSSSSSSNNNNNLRQRPLSLERPIHQVAPKPSGPLVAQERLQVGRRNQFSASRGMIFGPNPIRFFS